MYRLTNIDSNGKQYNLSHKKPYHDSNKEDDTYYFIVWKGRLSRHVHLEKKFSLNFYGPEDTGTIYESRRNALKTFFDTPWADSDNSFSDKVKTLLDSKFWNLSLAPASSITMPSLSPSYYKYYNIISRKISPVAKFTAAINSTEGIKFMYPYRASIWERNISDVAIARRLPWKASRILIKPFIGKIEPCVGTFSRQNFAISPTQKSTYDDVHAIRAYGTWSDTALEIGIHRPSYSATRIYIVASLIKI